MGLVLIAFALGVVIAWVIAQTRAALDRAALSASRSQAEQYRQELEQLRQRLHQELERRTTAEVRLDEAEKGRQQLTETFQTLAGKALQDNSRLFLDLAESSLKEVLANAKGALGEREEAIKGLVQPLQDTLETYRNQVTRLEKDRANEYGQLTNQLTSLFTLEQEVRSQTDKLVSALRQPQARGRWGELTLKRVVELAGLSAYCDFSEQVSLDAGERRLQPDMIIRLPGGRKIVVDAKTPLDAYIDALEEPDKEKQVAALRRHAGHLRSHMTQLSQKSYWEQLPETPEFVVMFIPGESFFSAAVELDVTLIEDAMSNKVVPATPTTLVALLKAVAYGWRQEQLSKNAQEISKLGRDAYKRFLTLFEHLETLRTHLGNAVDSFNTVVGSLERRVLPGLRKFQELGAGEQELPSPEQVEQTPRRLSPPELGGEDSALLEVAAPQQEKPKT